MSTGSGSTGGAGYRVEVDNLREFAKQVRGLLSDFEAGADAARAHGDSGVAKGAFGPFPEAEALYEKYADMRDALRDVLRDLYDAIDEAQHKADLTASNYEEQEHDTSRHLKVNTDDGWSVGQSAKVTTQTAAYRAPVAPVSPTAAPAPPPPTPVAGGTPRPHW